jgi:hypothetical protein
MRPTALRQSPKDVSGPKHFRQMKRNPLPNDLHITLLCDRKPTSTEAGKRGKTGLHTAPYGGAGQDPCNIVHFNPLSELTTLNIGTCKDHLSLKTAPTKHSPHISLLPGSKYLTGTLGASKLGNGMRSRDGRESNALPHPLHDRKHTSPLLGISTTWI